MRANTERLYKDVAYLTSITPARNFQNLASLKKASHYIKDEFAKAGAKPDMQQWFAQGREYTNMIASYNPSKKQRLIVGAHYDVCGDQPGADDNASAVAGLLEIARLVNEAKPTLNHQLEFVAYNFEEPPFFATEQMGSAVHAKTLSQTGAKVK